MAEATPQIQYQDIIPECGLTDTIDGIYYVRTVKVSNIIPPANDASGDNARAAFLYTVYKGGNRAHWTNAAEAAGLRIRKFGEPHPTIPGLICERVEIRGIPSDPRSIKATEYYRDLFNVRIRINGALRQETTAFDRDLKLMEVRWKEGASGEPPSGEADSDYGESPVWVPGTLIEFDYVGEVIQMNGTPFDLNKLYASRTNSEEWQGSPKYTWLCVDVSGAPYGRIYRDPVSGQHSFDNGEVNQYWQYHFAFQFVGYERGTEAKPITNVVHPILTYRRNQTGRIPRGVDPVAEGYPTITVGNGWKQFKLQREADFNVLNLPAVNYQPGV